MSLTTDAEQAAEVILRLRAKSLTREERKDQMEGAKTEKGPEITESEGLEDEISRPQASQINATLQIPSLEKVDPLVGHGGSTFQKKRLAQELVREKHDPSEHVKQHSKMDFPLEEKAHLPQDVMKAVRCVGEMNRKQSKLSGKAGKKKRPDVQNQRRDGETLCRPNRSRFREGLTCHF